MWYVILFSYVVILHIVLGKTQRGLPKYMDYNKTKINYLGKLRQRTHRDGEIRQGQGLDHCKTQQVANPTF